MEEKRRPDRQKVLQALEHCENDGSCSDCIYNDEGFMETGCRINADVIALLKDEEAVIPYIDIDEAKCPVCKVKLTRQELIGEDVLFEDFFDYCPHCGKPVNWEGR